MTNIIRFSIWFWYFRAKHLLDGGFDELMAHQLMARAAPELSQLVCSQLLLGRQLVILPASLSVSLAIRVGYSKLSLKTHWQLFQVSNSNKPIASPNLHKVTHEELGQYLITVVTNHAERVARWGLAPETEVKHDMLNGMRRMWSFASQNPVSWRTSTSTLQRDRPEAPRTPMSVRIFADLRASVPWTLKTRDCMCRWV